METKGDSEWCVTIAVPHFDPWIDVASEAPGRRVATMMASWRVSISISCRHKICLLFSKCDCINGVGSLFCTLCVVMVMSLTCIEIGAHVFVVCSG